MKKPTNFLNEGVHEAPSVPKDYRLETNQDRFSKAASLADLQPEFVFLHHAVLLAIGFDPLPIYYGEQHLPDTLRPCQIFLDQPYIENIAAPYDRLLTAIPSEVWPGLSMFLDQIAVTDRISQTLWKSLRQYVPVLDQWALKKLFTSSERAPTVMAHFIGLDGNRACFHYDPALDPLLGKIVLKKDEPYPETIREATALWAGKNPFTEPNFAGG
jgi:hypothetical protein